MNAREAAMLCRLAKAMCPQQAIDEATPDAWHLLLDDIPFEDAKAALAEVAKRQPFVAPAEIRAKVRQVRDKRIAEYGPIEVPAHIETESGYREYLGQMRRQIGDGTVERPERDPWAELPKRDMRAIEGTFRSVDEEPTA